MGLGDSMSAISMMKQELDSQVQSHQKLVQNDQKKIKAIQIRDFVKSKPNINFDLPYDPNYFLPQNFEKFILTGEYNKVLIQEQQSIQKVKPIFVTGCGRSGTTLLFKILIDTFKKADHVELVALNEPREIYLNAIGEEFDLWSN